MEKEDADITREDIILRKSHAMIRCAKSAMLLLSLKATLPDHCLETEALRKEHEKESLITTSTEELKIELVMERIKRRQMEFRRTVDLALQITLLLSLWIVGLMLVVSGLY